ncbi:MAG: transporter [Woeseiaceae bacterium]|nr:transporter [Woeseiaceae bacterium]
MQTTLRAMTAACAVLVPLAAPADEGTRADSHAPIGVMADHYHERGEWMFSYRFMSMSMDGNLQGSDAIAPETIVTTEPNAFAGQPMQPPTLRVVPLDMRMDMHMLGMMYAPTDRITLMAMTSFLDNAMDHVTYQGGAGTTVLGTFTTKSSGLGDSSLTALVSIIDSPHSKFHIIGGLSFPTGSIDETDTILTPMNTTPSPRLPYPMQLGSGTVDPLVGASYMALHGTWSWGGQWRSTFRAWDNDDDYHLGSEHRLTGWASYLWSHAFSTSVRLEHYRRENIDGADPLIVAPVQTADPDRQEIRRTELGLGVNWAGTGTLEGYRVALEYLVPFQQDLAGPQLETDSRLVLGVQKSW